MHTHIQDWCINRWWWWRR